MSKPSFHINRFIRGLLTTVVVLTAFSILAPALASANQRLEVTGLRVGVHSDKTRVVLDVSGDVSFMVTPVGDGDTIIVEIPGVTWRTNTHRSIGRGLIRSYEYEGGDGSGFLALATKGPVTVKKSFALSPSRSGGYRIVIDLVSTGAYPETHADGTVVGTVDQKQMPADNDKGLVVAGTDSDTVTVSVTEIAQYYPRHSQMPQYVQRPAFGNDSPAPRRSPLGIMGGSDSSPSGWYISGNVGFTTLGEADFTDNFSVLGVNVSALGDSDFSSGYSLAVAVGHSWENFRFEGEISYRKNDLDSLTINSIGAAGVLITTAATVDLDGDISALGFMANGYYDFDTDGKLTPYVMAGIGGANISLDIESVAGVDATYDESDMVPAYQAGVGFGYDIGFGTVLNAQYRFFGTFEPTFDDGGDEIESEYLSHNFLIGITQRF